MEQVISQLKARDTEVRAHEMAHLMVAGQYARGMSFTYQTGPDGKRYAIGGEVGIDTSPVSGDPQATIDKARIVQRAALAPAEPSSQDQRVAQAAQQMMMQAMAELRQSEDTSEVGEQNSTTENNSAEINNEQNLANRIKPAESESLNLRQTDAGMASLAMARQQFDVRMQIS